MPVWKGAFLSCDPCSLLCACVRTSGGRNLRGSRFTMSAHECEKRRTEDVASIAGIHFKTTAQFGTESIFKKIFQTRSMFFFSLVFFNANHLNCVFFFFFKNFSETWWAVCIVALRGKCSQLHQQLHLTPGGKLPLAPTNMQTIPICSSVSAHQPTSTWFKKKHIDQSSSAPHPSPFFEGFVWFKPQPCFLWRHM